MPRPCWRFNGRDAPVRSEPRVWWTGRRARREHRLRRMIAACSGDEKRARGLVRNLQEGFRVCNTESTGMCAYAESLVRECVASHKARIWQVAMAALDEPSPDVGPRQRQYISWIFAAGGPRAYLAQTARVAALAIRSYGTACRAHAAEIRSTQHTRSA